MLGSHENIADNYPGTERDPECIGLAFWVNDTTPILLCHRCIKTHADMFCDALMESPEDLFCDICGGRLEVDQ